MSRRISDRVVDGARAVAQATRTHVARRSRRLPSFTTRAMPSTSPTIYYFSPYQSEPSGGIRTIYRHVDELNGLGIRASVVHAQANRRCDWFQNSTSVVGADSITLHPNDTMVIPEFYGSELSTLPSGVRTVIFNQGVYYTFAHIPYGASQPGAPYRNVPGLLGLLTVSENSASYLEYAFPSVPVHIARPVIDPEIFHPESGMRRRRIAFTTSRRAEDRNQLLHILRSRRTLDGWELAPIAGQTERDTARIMRSAPLFLSFSEREGFGLPPAEAMASGCYVIGYTGLGGREFFDTNFCSPVSESDVVAFGRAVESAVATYERDPIGLAERGEIASRHVLTRYSVEGLREDLLSFYGNAL